MTGFAGSRKRIPIWVFVRLFLAVCGRLNNDPPAAISSNQAHTVSVVQIAREAVNDRLR
jgi:hypothetical protein